MLWHERLNFELFEVLIWFDFMQNLTTPLANIETNTIFFGSAQMDMTVFGVLVFQSSVGQGTWLRFPLCQLVFVRFVSLFFLTG